jgi:CP family cyanate transporter-like MFS transporter
VAWWIALFFAMQAMQAYIVTGWLTQILVDAGVDLGAAGSAVAAFALAGLPMAMVIPLIARRQSRFPAIAVGLAACYVAGYVGLLVSPSSGYLIWAAMAGLGGGAFPFAMLIVAIRAHSFDALTALSAFAQSTAYLFATLGPFAIGLLYDVTEGWTVPIWTMIAAAVAMGGFGVLAVRPRYIDQVPSNT